MINNDANQFKEVIEALGAIALADNHISAEEFALIKQVSFDLLQYEKTLNIALADGVVTDQENENLRQLLDQIKENAFTVARKDKIITKDEINLIKKISEIWEKYYKA